MGGISQNVFFLVNDCIRVSICLFAHFNPFQPERVIHTQNIHCNTTSHGIQLKQWDFWICAHPRQDTPFFVYKTERFPVYFVKVLFFHFLGAKLGWRSCSGNPQSHPVPLRHFAASPATTVVLPTLTCTDPEVGHPPLCESGCTVFCTWRWRGWHFAPCPGPWDTTRTVEE